MKRNAIVGACVFLCGAVCFGATSVAKNPRPKLVGPKEATVNEPVRLKAREFPAKAKLRVFIRPKGSKGFSIGSNLPETFSTNKAGKATVKFRFPQTYRTCIPDQGCFDGTWNQGFRAEILVRSKSPRKRKATRVVTVNGPSPIA